MVQRPCEQEPHTTRRAAARRFSVARASPTDATTEGPRGAGGSSSPCNRDGTAAAATVSSPCVHRWVPPSVVRRDAPINSADKNDLVFRKVRGILNKLTPEKFHKLRKELLLVGLDSTHILKGVILLIFDKALDEPKYSCMYASLCRELCDESPNFEPPPSSSSSSQTTTFRRLLLTKCQDEFENRRRANEAFERRNGPLTPDEQEQRLVAKHKMLGNIKFIGELGKQGLLQESILHQCVQQLLVASARVQSGGDWQDLECLCQILVTVGRRLDTPRARPLMDQYFERMRTLSHSPELPARIRFLLRDVIELRANRWVPRRGAAEHGPRTLQQIRDEASRDLGIYCGSRVSGPRAASLGGGMDDVFAPLPMASLGTGPGVIPSGGDRFFPYRAGGSARTPLNNSGGFLGGGGGGNFYNGRNNQPPPQQFGRGQRGGEHLPPRFLKKQSPGSADEISLRPAQNSIVLKPKTPLSFSKTNTGSTGSTPLGPHPLAKQAMKEPPIVIKQVVQDKNRANRSAPEREKGATREEVIARVDELLASLKFSNGAEQQQSTTTANNATNNNGTTTPPGSSDNGLPDEASRAFEALKIPRKFLSEALAHAMLATLDKPQAELLPQMALAYKKDGGAAYLEALQEVFGRMSALEAEMPLVKSMVAGHVARGVAKGLITLSDVASALPQGQHYPLFLLVLQQLARTQGRPWLTQGLAQAKVDLESLLPEGNRGPERLAEVLEDRGLGFLLPRLQGDLWRQLKADPSATALYRWIRDSVDPQQQTQPAFVHALVTCLLRYILGQTTMPQLLNTNQGTNDSENNESTVQQQQQNAVAPERAQLDKERELLERYQALLRAFLGERSALQLTALYALQTLWHSLGFPKGMLLRWFVLLYDLEIVEEEAFLKWKEDVNDDYPGKGKALFQVNQWLTWLEEAEEEEEEDEEDCSDEGDN
ncbi:eukaryotic translation initiation factor 4 gamma 2 isoform X3 [Dermacentor albipictus]|uniref:eukaryotic translation initiation factor 4 gamma 2 isoform X2 n=1 Tax=Dermacentor albipictus TaxID=60249 RepID=UPI0038FCF290